ncbi:MAG: competence/damage-inducible protein A [Leptolyngbyaceae bacterium]|nr:competence/damage-inducible protein A [Leptolyngbyaceae bacterium]
MTASAEIICVGTELLLGDILNSNAQFLGQQLAKLGIPHYYQTVVGDNRLRIQKTIAIACERSQLLIFTGGLGPTPDDLTHEAIAEFFDSPLVERPEIIETIRQRYAHRNPQSISPSNDKQARIPQGANILPNPIGSAPGIIWEARPGLTILTFPGVPREMQVMWEETAVPYLQSHGLSQFTIYSRMLRYWGIPEATLSDTVKSFFDLENPTVAPYASNGEVRLRISAKADSQDAAMQIIAPIEEQIKALTSEDCFGVDDETLASAVATLLMQSDHTISVAESCTGGGLGHLLTTQAGSSAYFKGGIIAYSNSVKINLLGVSEADLAREGAVSETVAKQMAVGVRSALESTWGLSITGIAGPGGGSEDKPVGLVYFGIAGPDQVVFYRRVFASFRGRDWIRWLSACTALDLLRRLYMEKRK